MYEGHRTGMELKHIPSKHPAFYLEADPDTDPDPRSETNADPGGSGSKPLQPRKLNFTGLYGTVRHIQ
jgi:hypothetical protein